MSTQSTYDTSLTLLRLLRARKPAQSVSVQTSRHPTLGNSDLSANFDDTCEHRPYKWNCSQIRTKISAIIRSGEMKVTHFQKELEINSNSYGRFMKYKGPYGGSDNSTYREAHNFFLRREAQGIKAPRAKKARTEDLHKFDVSGIQLPKEADDEVEVFDTCDDVRSKIQAHLGEPGVTQAGFCRELAKTCSCPARFQSKQIKDFLHKKGALAGNTSSVYYASYVFFENLRLKNSQSKSQKRKSVETIHHTAWKETGVAIMHGALLVPKYTRTNLEESRCANLLRR